MTIDIHVHHVPERFARFVARAAPYGMRLDVPQGESVTLHAHGMTYGLTRTFFDPERLVARLGEMRVDEAVLSLATPFVHYGVPASLGSEAAELYNDEIAALRKAAPGKFESWAYLPMQDAWAAAKELRRGVTTLGCVGGYLSSNVNGRYLDAAEFDPIFAAASDLGVPLFIHPSNPPGRDRTGPYELTVVAGYLFDTTLNVFHMIFGGLFDRYPDLKVCCTHLGGYAPLLHARMQRELDTNPALAARLKRPLRDYLRALWFDTICFEPPYARAVIEAGTVDPSRLVLGSDTPFPLGEPDPVGFAERAFGEPSAERMAPGLVRRVMQDNVRAFLSPARGA